MFYTYAYLREDKTPYYIGKGSGNRINEKHHFPLPPIDRRIFLKQNLTEDDAFKHEIYLIKILPNLRNKTSGGEGLSGYKHTPETRKIISAKRALQKFTPEVIARRAKSNTGKKRTPQQCKNLSEGCRHKPITFVNKYGEVVTTTLIAEFCREYNLTHSNISKVMKGKRQQHKGWRLHNVYFR